VLLHLLKRRRRDLVRSKDIGAFALHALNIFKQMKRDFVLKPHKEKTTKAQALVVF